jgi:hypothetical protein
MQSIAVPATSDSGSSTTAERAGCGPGRYALPAAGSAGAVTRTSAIPAGLTARPARWRADRKTERRQLGSRMTPPLGMVNSSWSACLPATAAAISAARNRQRNSAGLMDFG